MLQVTGRMTKDLACMLMVIPIFKVDTDVEPPEQHTIKSMGMVLTMTMIGNWFFTMLTELHGTKAK